MVKIASCIPIKIKAIPRSWFFIVVFLQTDILRHIWKAVLLLCKQLHDLLIISIHNAAEIRCRRASICVLVPDTELIDFSGNISAGQV